MNMREIGVKRTSDRIFPRALRMDMFPALLHGPPEVSCGPDIKRGTATSKLSRRDNFEMAVFFALEAG